MFMCLMAQIEVAQNQLQNSSRIKKLKNYIVFNLKSDQKQSLHCKAIRELVTRC